jgi:ubiquinone/menaquinone biosynthesis C-methylase UbiE
MPTAFESRYLPGELAPTPRGLLAWGRYLALHEAIRLPLIGAHRLTSLVARVAARRRMPARDLKLESAVRERYWALLARDFENTRDGLYPERLLFDVPLGAYAHSLPRFLLDAPRILGRIEAGDHADLPRDVDLSAYPAYYRRNFHWQTDGYFSRHSAALYDLGVELLFIGVADVMRRQALAEVMRRKAPGPIRLLDVGTGTGRFLAQAARALPDSIIVGVDLSPWYVEHAREQLGAGTVVGAPRVEVANAEGLPFEDESFDAVTCIFLLHELPRRVRRTVLAELRRVLKSGGLLVLEDAAQPSDAPELRPVLEQFSKDMHEPFFADYQQDDLAALLESAGFSAIRVGSHFVAKVASARKSAAPNAGDRDTTPG